jgi:hypothetical protein
MVHRTGQGRAASQGRAGCRARRARAHLCVTPWQHLGLAAGVCLVPLDHLHAVAEDHEGGVDARALPAPGQAGISKTCWQCAYTILQLCTPYSSRHTAVHEKCCSNGVMSCMHAVADNKHRKPAGHALHTPESDAIVARPGHALAACQVHKVQRGASGALLPSARALPQPDLHNSST